MLSDCLNNYIGYRGFCSDTIPDSGLYVNDLPSISLKLISNIAEGEQKDFTGLIDEINTRTFNEFESDVMNKTQKFFKTNVLLEKDITGHYKDPYKVVSSSAEYKGVSIELRDDISNYLSIYINTVQFYLDTATESSIFIYNTLNGELLDTIAFSGSIGMNRIEVNKSYPTYGQDTNIFICYLATSIDSISVDNTDQSVSATIRGAKVAFGSQIIDANLSYGDDAFGIVVDYNIRCDISEFICSSRDLFKYALWWKLGASIMFERMTSNRMNKYTLNKSAVEIKELWEYYEEKYNGIMDSVIPNLKKNEDAVCFSCNRKRNYKYNMP